MNVHAAHTILLVSFWISVFGGAIRLLCLTVSEYPRSLTYARWEDALSILGSVAWGLWLGITLWS